MKQLLFVFAITLFSYHIQAQSITLKCGNNEVKIDSAININCSFFTDSIVSVYFDNPLRESRIQVLYMAEDAQPSVSWHNINTDTRAAVFKPATLSRELCRNARWIITYTNGNINIQRYFINLEL